MKHGELFVMISGHKKMLLLPVDRLDSLDSVCALVLLKMTIHVSGIQLLYLPFTDGSALPRAAFGQGTGPIHLDDLMCTGREATLFDCPFAATHNCIHFEDAGVRCNPIRTLNPNNIILRTIDKNISKE